MMVTMYVHPTCTGCKKAEEFLRNAGVDVERRNYFKDRFTEDELRTLLKEMTLSAHDVLSKRSRPYLARRDEIDGLDDDALIRAMVGEPRLVRRPIVTAASAHVVGAKQADLEQFVDEIQR